MPSQEEFEQLRSSLSEKFGFDRFRPGQRELIEAVLSKRDALGVLPTGGGKSLTYQLPAVLFPGLTLVVSPLIALMKDQVDAFNRRGLKRAVALHSNVSAADARFMLAQIHSGEASILYVAPERLVIPSFRERIVGLKPGLVVIDEAHCVNQWGYDFRPSYLSLTELVDRLRPAPVLALTATATPATRREILDRLKLVRPLVHVESFDRPNLRFEVHPCTPASKMARLRHLLQGAAGSGSHLVYVGRRRDADHIAAELSASGLTAVSYHAGLPPQERHLAQEAWLNGEKPIAVATVAFGMGIDKPDVRTVVHYQHPASLEAYYQEAGRAGRDQKPARCVMLYSSRDLALAHFFIRNRYPSRPQVERMFARIQPEGAVGDTVRFQADDMSDEQYNVALQALLEQGLVWLDQEGLYHREDRNPDSVRIRLDGLFARKKKDYERLDELVAYCKEAVCNRRALLRYFGEALPADHRCGNCSACLGTAGASAAEAAFEEACRIYRSHAAPLQSRGPLSALDFARFLGTTQSKRFPVEWRMLQGYGAMRSLPLKKLQGLAERVLEKEAAGARITGQLQIPGPDAVFWHSSRRSFTTRELVSREVPRKIGLLILGLVAAAEGEISPSQLANLLRGKRALPVAHPVIAGSRFAGALVGRSYRKLMADVLAMWAKGYMRESPGTGRKLELTLKGRNVLNNAPS